MRPYFSFLREMGVLFSLLCISLSSCAQSDQKQIIPIDKNGKYGVVYVTSYISTKSNAALKLVDEQTLGEDLDEPAKSEWQPLFYNNWMGKGTSREVRPWITLDFPDYYEIEEIAYFDGPGTGKFRIYTGDVPDWIHPDSLKAHEVASAELDKYQKWVTLPVSPHKATRRVLIEIDRKDSTSAARAPVEIIFYGKKVKDAPKATPYDNPLQHALVRDFWGVNTFNDDPQGPKMAFSRLRNYHNWEWVEYKQDTLLFEGNSQNGFNFNRYYNNMARLGLENWPVLKATPSWLRKGGSNNWAPAPPETYDSMMLGGMFGEYAQYHRIWADKYGQSDEKGKDVPGGQIRYLQVGNEWDKNWDDRESLMLPWEYAAMVSQVADSLQHARGKVALLDAPTARPDLHYKKAVAMWFEAFDKPFPFAAIADHHYSNDSGGQGYSKKGVSPEADSAILYTHTLETGEWIDKWLPENIEYWRTEYGYDTHPESGQGAPSIKGKSEETVQAEWTIRGALYHASLPMDELYMYMLRDVDQIGGKYAKGKYRTSGFLRSKALDYAKKPSWYYANTFLEQLGDYRFAEWLPSGDKDIRIQKWLHEDGTTPAYVVWRGTSDGSVTNNYRLKLPGGPDITRAIGYADKEPSGVSVKFKSESGSAVLAEVTESPVMLFTSGTSGESTSSAARGNNRTVIPPGKLKKLPKPYRLTPDMISNDAGKVLVDNQDGVGDPLGGSGKVLDNEPNLDKGYNLPMTVTITLPEPEDVAWLYFFDTNGDGRMSIEVEDNSGKRTFIGNEYFQVYMKWTDWAVGKKIRKIHLTFHEQGANLKEVVVYTR